MSRLNHSASLAWFTQIHSHGHRLYTPQSRTTVSVERLIQRIHDNTEIPITD